MARRRQPTARSSSRRPRPSAGTAAGFSAIELLFVVALMTTICGIAVPPMVGAVETLRAAGAARYVSTRLQRARMEAVVRGADVSVRFTTVGDTYEFATYVDGNRNGVLARDILRGVDWRLGAVERLPANFVGVEFGVMPGLPAVDPGGVAPGADPIRLGASSAATFTAAGTSSTGSLYILGRNRRQYVVRVYGDTGKTRVLRFDEPSRLWKPI